MEYLLNLDPGVQISIVAVTFFFAFLGYKIWKKNTKKKSTSTGGPRKGDGPRPNLP